MSKGAKNTDTWEAERVNKNHPIKDGPFCQERISNEDGYKYICKWIKNMLDSNADISLIVDALYQAGILKYEERRMIERHF